MERFSALIGFVVILGIAFLLSNNKRAIRWRTVGWGLSLQIVIAEAPPPARPLVLDRTGARKPREPRTD